MSVAADLRAVREKVARATIAAGRPEGSVVLVAVSKMQAVEKIVEAYEAGQRDFGENYAQELVAKAEALADRCPELRWHFIGRLQKNKINALSPHVYAWHTIDGAETAAALGKRVEKARGFLQVNVGREPQKGGVLPEAVKETIGAMPFRPVGLMAIPPAEGDAAAHFRALAALRDAHLAGGELSMGMSHDFVVAIACGATAVRVGTAIFGDRARL